MIKQRIDIKHYVYTDAEKYLISTDDIMGTIIHDNYPLEDREERHDYFASLSRSIVGQQISVKAATSVYNRLVEVTKLDPSLVLNMTDEQSEYIGLSRQKRRYLMDLSSNFMQRRSVFINLSSLNDDDVITELTNIKGIGVWTAQMFLMFTLRRQDIFAPDDKGLQTAIEVNYSFDKTPTRSELIKLSMNWSPYRTTACLYLWQSLHNTPQ